MAKLPTYEEMAKKVAKIAMDEFLFDGRSIREWVQLIASEDAISRQAVLEYIEGSEAELGHSSENELVCQDIKDLPSILPQSKIKMGEWIDDKCSICGKGIRDLIYSPEWYENERPNFCPFCGMKMEAESEI